MSEKESKNITSSYLPKHMKKGHQLVFSRQDLSAREADLFALMIARMTPEDWSDETPRYEFSANQLCDWLGVDSKHIASNLAPVADRLSVRKIGLNSLDKKGEIEEFDFSPLFKRIKYVKKERKLIMVPNDELKAEYIAYNQGFALINTRHYLILKKEYSKRLYELLSRFKKNSHIKSYPIDELKGLFGLLDEEGKLKKDKTSFKSTAVFLQRCVRESIKEISTTSDTKKEIMFLKSDSGELGYKPIKNGRTIIAVEFLYQWVNQTPVTSLNIEDAKKTIKKLEIRRLQNKEKLNQSELKSLAASYEMIGEYDIALKIKSILKPTYPDKDRGSDDNIENFLEKINKIKEINGSPEYEV